ncbi:hypothetical protein AAFF_G00416940 [Aldrovandia affinis]|uniref:Uncharacterized protein n=1 Tax=Aldrovandia affinis TaxID=143900 RepID=A0AAD7WJB4_9TELE|nr:hypothetical protein AAFF_G00416940 [Aldrovandia affinis]
MFIFGSWSLCLPQYGRRLHFRHRLPRTQLKLRAAALPPAIRPCRVYLVPAERLVTQLELLAEQDPYYRFHLWTRSSMAVRTPTSAPRLDNGPDNLLNRWSPKQLSVIILGSKNALTAFAVHLPKE